jgi:hypothetical protein
MAAEVLEECGNWVECQKTTFSMPVVATKKWVWGKWTAKGVLEMGRFGGRG